MRARVAVDAGLGVNPASSCADSGSSCLVSVPPPPCPPVWLRGSFGPAPRFPFPPLGGAGNVFAATGGGGLRVDALIIGGPAGAQTSALLRPAPSGHAPRVPRGQRATGRDGARATEPPGGNGAHSRDHEWSHGATGRKPRTTRFPKCQGDQLRGHGATRACCGGSAKGREEMPQATSTANQ